MSFLLVKNATKWDVAKQSKILSGVSFELEQYKKLAIAGETGSGKSTLMKIIAGTLQADDGSIYFEQKEVLGPDDKLLPWHPSIGYLSQHFELRNNYRVEEVLAIANKINEKEAGVIFEVCRIDHLLKHRTNQLSGGEKQRIATAQALIRKPKLLLLDEPYSNLDVIHKNILKKVLNDITSDLKITCILTSHDPLDTLSWADEIKVLKNGAFIQSGTPLNIYHNPIDEYTAGLFGKYTLLPKALASKMISESSNGLIEADQIVRPNNFKLITNDNGVKGTIKNVYFLGDFLEVEILVAGVSLTVLTDNLSLKVDDEVNVVLKHAL